MAEPAPLADRWPGGRFRWPISSRWQLRAAGHLGGLGIGSDLAWGLEGSIYCNVLSNLSVGLGYRFWAIDCSTGSADELFVYDVTHSGPGIGVIFRSY